MPKLLIEQMKQLARLEGIGYQPYVRKVMTQHVRENEDKLERLMTPAQATEKADKLFAQALKLNAQIPQMQPLSNERISQSGCSQQPAVGGSMPKRLRNHSCCNRMVLHL